MGTYWLSDNVNKPQDPLASHYHPKKWSGELSLYLHRTEEVCFGRSCSNCPSFQSRNARSKLLVHNTQINYKWFGFRVHTYHNCTLAQNGPHYGRLFPPVCGTRLAKSMSLLSVTSKICICSQFICSDLYRVCTGSISDTSGPQIRKRMLAHTSMFVLRISCTLFLADHVVKVVAGKKFANAQEICDSLIDANEG